MTSSDRSSTNAWLDTSRRRSIIGGLSEASQRSKDRTSFMHNLLQREELSTELKRSSRLLSEFEADHRKRLRRVKQIWMTLGTEKQLPEGLVSVTEMLLRESATLSTALEPLRKQSLFDVRSGSIEMWKRLSRSASSFTGASMT